MERNQLMKQLSLSRLNEREMKDIISNSENALRALSGKYDGLLAIQRTSENERKATEKLSRVQKQEIGALQSKLKESETIAVYCQRALEGKVVVSETELIQLREERTRCTRFTSHNEPIRPKKVQRAGELTDIVQSLQGALNKFSNECPRDGPSKQRCTVSQRRTLAVRQVRRWY